MSLQILEKDLISPNESVRALGSRYEDARNWHARKNTRIIDNWHFYWGLDAELGNGQWPADVVGAMLQQKRQLLTYNFAKVIVDSMAGGIMQSLFDPKYIPVSEKVTLVTETIKKAMYSDKELMDWDAAWLEFVVHGLIGEGILKMYVSKQYDDLGNIGFRCMTPGSVTTDPSWKSRSARDIKVCWQEGWYDTNELCELFPQKTDLILAEVFSPSNTGKTPTYGPNYGIVPWNSSENAWGDKKKVISEYRMVEKRVEKEFALVNGEEIEIPEMDNMSKPQWLNANYPNWNPDMVFIKPTVERFCKVEIVCPSLAGIDFLYSGKSQVQCGQVPFFIWAATMHNGERHTTIDAVKDACRNINYWHSMLTHRLQVEGGGGSKFVDPAGFKDNAEYLKFCNSYNDPTQTFETKPGILVDGKGMPVKPTVEGQVRGDILALINNTIQVILPQISKVNPATVGRVEPGNQTSGRLFQMLKTQSDQQVFTTHLGLKVCFNEIYDGYFNQAINLYSNEDVERTFTFGGGKESITLNQESVDENGEKVLLNRVSDLKGVRHKTIISETQSSPSDKMNNMMIFNEYLQGLAPIAQFKPATIGIVSKKIAENIDQFNEEDKEDLEKAAALESELQIAQIELAISNARFQKVQVDLQMQQLTGVPAATTPGQPSNPVVGSGSQLPNGVQQPPETMGTLSPVDINPMGATSPKGAM